MAYARSLYGGGGGVSSVMSREPANLGPTPDLMANLAQAGQILGLGRKRVPVGAGGQAAALGFKGAANPGPSYVSGASGGGSGSGHAQQAQAPAAFDDGMEPYYGVWNERFGGMYTPYIPGVTALGGGQQPVAMGRRPRR